MELKKFIKEICGFGIVFLICAIAISTLLYQHKPEDIYLYETDLTIAKLTYYNEHKEDVDTLFIGSSLTEQGIIPEVFDEIAKTNSYNIAVRGMRVHRVMQMIDQVIATENPSLKHVFVEMRPEIVDPSLNYMSNPVIFATRWALLPSFIENMSLRLQRNVGYNKYSLFVHTVRRYAYKYIGFGVKKQIQIIFGKSEYEVSEPRYNSVAREKGFHMLQHTTEGGDEYNERVMEKALWHDYSVNAKKLKVDLYTEKLMNKAHELRTQGVYVTFIIPPRSNYLRYLIGQKQVLQQRSYNVIDMADYNKYPYFYFNDEYAADLLHLNAVGAETYTTELAKKFMEIKNSSQIDDWLVDFAH